MHIVGFMAAHSRREKPFETEGIQRTNLLTGCPPPVKVFSFVRDKLFSPTVSGPVDRNLITVSSARPRTDHLVICLRLDRKLISFTASMTGPVTSVRRRLNRIGAATHASRFVLGQQARTKTTSHLLSNACQRLPVSQLSLNLSETAPAVASAVRRQGFAGLIEQP